ncbi:hypothetical protein EV667_2122 [Ancylobacter aquaticus]|uniref:Uncharacterized protein n=1 Tax=Ancylobacter aquaticus TaxID=100 RepID=A0A4V2PJD6_ANCAQ|nr:hypothetical protein [Ancylobacter aquaticus]TCK28126.1 hypothetical protein EV667_2122 [Ancylobacter aquaticus]
MSSRYVRLDPETVRLLDRCIAQAQEAAARLNRDGVDEAMRTRLASALMEAISLGERDEGRLVAFALQVLPAYRERLARPSPPPLAEAPGRAFSDDRVPKPVTNRL